MGKDTEPEIARAVMIGPGDPRTLGYFLSRFGLYMKLIQGDLKAIERIAYELVQDEGAQGKWS